MSERTQQPRGRIVGLAVLVCVAATALAGFLGLFASLLYGGLYWGPPEGDPAGETAAEHVRTIGAWWGAATGLIAGVLWCWGIQRKIAAAETERLVRAGTWLGLKVGVLSTLLLHVALMLVAGRVALVEPLVGLAFGIPSGLILGAICGAIARRVTVPRECATAQNSEVPDNTGA